VLIRIRNCHGVQCRNRPEPALYNGGILKFGDSGNDPDGWRTTETGVFSPAFVVYNLNKTTMYTFSCEFVRFLAFFPGQSKSAWPMCWLVRLCEPQ
jgi:hypothetical protein